MGMTVATPFLFCWYTALYTETDALLTVLVTYFWYILWHLVVACHISSANMEVLHWWRHAACPRHITPFAMWIDCSLSELASMGHPWSYQPRTDIPCYLSAVSRLGNLVRILKCHLVWRVIIGGIRSNPQSLRWPQPLSKSFPYSSSIFTSACKSQNPSISWWEALCLPILRDTCPYTGEHSQHANWCRPSSV